MSHDRPAAARPVVFRTALLLGYAGLLPQAFAVVIEAAAGKANGGINAIVVAFGAGLALVYATVILSFLGGIWWGIAMRRGSGQAGLAALAVLPSLIGTGLLIFGMSGGGRGAWCLVGLGIALLLTLPVDHALARSGEAPEGWMRLRVPLSAGLGALTILAGILSPA